MQMRFRNENQVMITAPHERVPPRAQKIVEAMAEFGTLNRWMYYQDALSLLDTRAATRSKSCSAIFSQEKGLKHYKFKNTFIRQLVEVTGKTLAPNQGLMVFSSATTKSVASQAIAEIKFSFGALGIVVTEWPIGDLHWRFALANVLDRNLYFHVKSCYPDSVYSYGVSRSGEIGSKYYDYIFFMDNDPVSNIVTREEVYSILKRTIRQELRPVPPRSEPLNGKMFEIRDQRIANPGRIGQLGQLRQILLGMPRRVVDYAYIMEDVREAARTGSLVTSQDPERILAYYFRTLINEGTVQVLDGATARDYLAGCSDEELSAMRTK